MYLLAYKYFIFFQEILLEKIIPLLKFIPYANAINFDDDLIIITGIYLKNGGRITRQIADFIKSLGNSIKKNEGISLETFELLNLVLNILTDPLSQIKSESQNLVNLSAALREEIFVSIFKFLKYGISDKAENKHSHFLSYNLLIIAIQVKTKN